jgi:hypothetical protein
VTTRVTISVDVDIDRFDDDDLIDELRSRGYGVAMKGVGGGANIDMATAELRAGRRLEALILLERALGHGWAGVLTQGLIR